MGGAHSTCSFQARFQRMDETATLSYHNRGKIEGLGFWWPEGTRNYWDGNRAFVTFGRHRRDHG